MIGTLLAICVLYFIFQDEADKIFKNLMKDDEPQPTPERNCVWDWNRKGAEFNAQCGYQVYMDDTPADNEHLYCPKCGGRIQINET